MTELTESSVRAEVRTWLEANWRSDYSLLEWRNKLVDSGWGAPHWPTQWYGRDLPAGLVPVVDEEFARIGAVGVAKVGIRVLAAATILAHGSDQQKQRYLRPSLTGEEAWCQLFSEPGSGSDAAGAVTRADLKGDHWIVNGQKLWTSGAQKADWGLLLARTDWNKPKHAGLSYFILNMRQPGVEVQPLKQMNGHATFNQVFITDAVVQPDQLVSREGGGWAVTTTTLMHERRSADGLRSWGSAASNRPGQIYDEERAEMEQNELRGARMANNPNAVNLGNNQNIGAMDALEEELTDQTIDHEDNAITYMGEDAEYEDYDMDGDEMY